MSQHHRRTVTSQDVMPHQADGEEFQASVHNIWVSPPFGQQETRMEQTGYPFAGANCPTTEHSSNQQDCNPNFYAAGGSYTPSNGNQTLEHSCLDPSTMADAGYTHLPDYLSQSSCSGEDDFAPIIGSSNLGFSFTRLGPHDENRVVNPMQGSSMSSGTPQGSHLFPECDRACPMPQFSESLQELEDVDLTPRNPSDEPWHPHQSADTGTISREHPSFNHVPGFYPGYAPARSLPSEMEPSAQVLTSGNPANRSPRSMFLYPMARYTPSEEGDISDFRVMLGYHGAISTPTTANSGIWSSNSQFNMRQSLEIPFTSPSTPSVISETSSGVADPLPCIDPNCGVTFTGKHRRGNLGRHRRMFHDLTSNTNLICGVNGCTQVFRRSDAVRKHQIIKHGSARGSPNLRVPGPGYS